MRERNDSTQAVTWSANSSLVKNAPRNSYGILEFRILQIAIQSKRAYKILRSSHFPSPTVSVTNPDGAAAPVEFSNHCDPPSNAHI